MAYAFPGLGHPIRHGFTPALVVAGLLVLVNVRFCAVDLIEEEPSWFVLLLQDIKTYVAWLLARILVIVPRSLDKLLFKSCFHPDRNTHNKHGRDLPIVHDLNASIERCPEHAVKEIKQQQNIVWLHLAMVSKNNLTHFVELSGCQADQAGVLTILRNARVLLTAEVIMIRIIGLGISVSLFVSFLFTGCVTTGTFNAKVAEMNKAMEDQKAADQKALEDTRSDLTSQKKDCEDKLDTALSQKQILESKLTSMGQDVDQLLKEKGSLTQEVDELRKMRAAAEARNADFRSLLEKFRKMIDAGTLQVKVRNGRMVVQMQSDVLFASGSAQLKPDAKVAITEIANTIKGFPERRFQVVGHSDSTPIMTARFPSNWELSSQRAIEVVKLMVDAGVPPEMISGAGNAEFDPIAPNDSPENKAQNRRVEIVFMPKIDELPGFDTVLKSK